MEKGKTIKQPLFHISKRANLPWWKAWGIRAIAIIFASVLCIALSCIIANRSPFQAVSDLFEGNFGLGLVWDTMYAVAILLGITLAVTPAFKMKFWNIGAEGQTLMGCLACGFCDYYLGGTIPDGLLIVIMFISSLVIGAIWAVIPAIFKAKWNTNETLFTLMMNYIATQLTLYCLSTWNKGKTTCIINHGILPSFINDYFIAVLVVTVLTIFSYIYLKNSKQGFEISMVGESQNTARYVGINVKKVIIRTLIISGLICGLMGYLLTNAEQQFTHLSVDGRGFTAIIVAWLAKFNPIYMLFTSFLVVFSGQGFSHFLSKSGVKSTAVGDVITGILFLFIIGCEFFIRYQIKKTKNKKEEK